MVEETINVAVRTIKADEGKVLTNGKAFSDVGGTVWLGSNDSADNWYEITEEEYQELIKKEQEALGLNPDVKI